MWYPSLREPLTCIGLGTAEGALGAAGALHTLRGLLGTAHLYDGLLSPGEGSGQSAAWIKLLPSDSPIEPSCSRCRQTCRVELSRTH